MARLPAKVALEDRATEKALNTILAYLREITPQPSGTVRPRRGANGTTFEAVNTDAPHYLLKFHELDDSGEFMKCRRVDAAGELLDGDTLDVLVALPFELRFTISNETIDGVSVIYSAYNTTSQTRHATTLSASEDQVIEPRYLADKTLIWAKSGQTAVKKIETDEDTEITTETPITLQDVNIGARGWRAV